MVNSTLLDSLIGLAFVYLSLSIVCSSLNEWLGAFLMRRPKVLRDAITRLLGDVLANKVYEDPLIVGLKTPRSFLLKMPKRFLWLDLHQDRDPSYIPDQTFVIALLNVLEAMPRHDAFAPILQADTLRNSIANRLNMRGDYNNVHTKQSLSQILCVIDSAKVSTVQDVINAIKEWFNAAMDRTTGWYKRRTQSYLFAWALVISFCVNADTIEMVKYLQKSPNAQALATFVAALQSQKPLDSPHQDISSTINGDKSRPDYMQTQTDYNSKIADFVNKAGGSTNNLQLLPGWTAKWRDEWFRPLKILGLLITATTVSMGAPFWFDMMNKLINLRATGPKSA